MIEPVRVVGAAFGDYRREQTYSGIPKYLFAALEKCADIVAYVNTRQLRSWDVLDSMLDFYKIRKYGRPGINANWLWSKKTLTRLSDRVEKQLRKVGEFDSFLQVGTHVKVQIDGVKSYCLLDMTVLQGIKSKQFSPARLKRSRTAEAVETQKKVFDTCSRIFTTSEWVKQSIICDYGIDMQKVFVVGGGVSMFENVDIACKLPNHNILFIGRDWQRKGGPILLEAFAMVNQYLPDSKLTIIGCSPAVSHRNVVIIGDLDKTDPRQMSVMHEALLNATVLCVPSVFEPLGLCFLEAQYYGVVPVTFWGEARDEAIQDGITGILVRERSPQAVSEAILGLLKNPNRTKQMGVTGYDYCRKGFTWVCVANKVMRFIREDK